MAISAILLIVALVSFLLGAFPSPPIATRVNLISLGLACWVASLLFGTH